MDGFRPIHKISGIYKENTTVCRIRQEGFRKFIEVKRKKYDTSCGFGKNKLYELEQNPSSICGKSFYRQQQQAVACAFKTQVAIKRQGRLLPGDLAVLCYVIN